MINTMRRNNDIIIPWRPIKWKPVYDNFIMFHLQGHTNIEIAEFFQYTPQQVGNVLRSPEAQSRINTLSARLKERVLDNVEDQLTHIKGQAIKKLTTVMNDETLTIKRPMETARLSIDVLKGLGTMKGADSISTNNTINGNVNIGLTGDQVNKLTDALLLSNKVLEDHKDD